MRLDDGGSVSWALALCLAAACGGDDDGGGPGRDSGAGGVVEVTTYVGEVPEPVAFVAVQDGDGAWEQLESEDGVYSFEVESGRYGFAHACEPSSLVISYFYSTLEESGRVNRGCSRQAGEADEATVVLTVNGMGVDEIGQVSVGLRETSFFYKNPVAEVSGVAAGARDVVVAVGPNYGEVDRIVVERDVELGAGDRLEMEIDLADAVVATPGAITLDGYYPTTRAVAYLETRNGSRMLFLTDGDPQMYPGYPDVEPGDMHRILVESPTPSRLPAAHHFIRMPRDLTLTFPEPVAIEEASAAATTPHVRGQVSFDRRDGATYAFTFRNYRPDRVIEGYISAGWLAGQPSSFTWEQPDLSGLTGWADSFALIDDQEVTATVTEFVGDVDPLLVLPQVPPSRQVEYAEDLDGKGVTLVEATATFVP